MRIGIEGQRLFRKKKHGMDMVALELIRNLQQIDHENEYVVFVKPDEDDKVITESDNVKIHPIEGGPCPIWEQVKLPRAAAQEQCDLLHCTSNTAPTRSDVPVMITLHDIIYLESLSILKKSGTWYQKMGNVYRRWNVPRVVKKSKRIITVSEFEKVRIKEFFGFSESDQRLRAVYNGVSEHFKPVKDESKLEEVKQKYQLPDKFLFFLGNTDPKKNTERVLHAYADYVSESEEPLKLVLLDYKENILDQALKYQGIEHIKPNIILPGYVINKDLPAIYSLSVIFLYPSLRESFGIPMLEAMSCGTPVITSNTSSMPEVSGGAARIVDPFKKEEITKAIVDLVTNEHERTLLAGQGLQQASKFTWKAMAENVLQIYKEIVHQKTQ